MKTVGSLWGRFLATVVLCLFVVTSCNTAKQLLAFDVVYNCPKVYFSYAPGDQKLSEIVLYSGKLSIDLDSILNANYIPGGFIASAYLSKLALTITAPAQSNFSWLQSARLVGSIDSTFKQATELAGDTAVIPNIRSLNFALKPVDLKPILFKNSYWMKILGTPSGQTPPSSSSMYLDSQVKLHIEPL